MHRSRGNFPHFIPKSVAINDDLYLKKIKKECFLICYFSSKIFPKRAKSSYNKFGCALEQFIEFAVRTFSHIFAEVFLHNSN
jgi:hypothetical protein